MGGFVGIEVAAESGATGRWPVGRYPPMRPGPPDAGGARLGGNAETERVTITIANPRVVNSKSLYALVDVEWGVWQILTPPGSNVSTELLIPGDLEMLGLAPLRPLLALQAPLVASGFVFAISPPYTSTRRRPPAVAAGMLAVTAMVIQSALVPEGSARRACKPWCSPPCLWDVRHHRSRCRRDPCRLQ
jgi:hypothetical protein